MSHILFEKTLIVGLGLIGGSFAKALHQHKISKEIFAFDLDLEAIDLAKNDGIIDGGADNLALLDKKFDFIVIATPLSVYEEIFDEISNYISPKTIIIDLGSLKNFITEILPKNLERNFIGCHPIAGSEKIGFENSDAELFLNKKFIICKDSKNDSAMIQKVEDLVKIIGCNVDFLDTKKHDEIYALVSHLPQFLSFLTKEFSPKNIKDEFLKTAFRLDDSDPEIWADIFELNEENMEEFYVKFFDNLEKNINVTPSSEKAEFNVTDIEFFETNFAAIFFRALVVKSYLEIPEIKTLKTYAGSGFRDFASIINILNYDPEKLKNLIQKNQRKITKIFDSLS